MRAAISFRKTHDLDELSHLAVPAHPNVEPLLAHLRARTYWGFAFRYPMPGENEGRSRPRPRRSRRRFTISPICAPASRRRRAPTTIRLPAKEIRHGRYRS